MSAPVDASGLGLLMQTPVLVGVGAAMIVAGLGGWLTETGDWYRSLRKPRWQPPNWLFGPAWTAIFALIVTGGVMAWNRAPDGSERSFLLLLFAVNGALNIAWSGLFFRLRRPDWAGIEVVGLWISIVALIASMRPYAPEAAWCLAPYLAWVSFASVLNWEIVRLNPRPGKDRAGHDEAERDQRRVPASRGNGAGLAGTVAGKGSP